MNRIRHKIAPALALFGGLVMAPAALSQTTGSASSGVDFELVGRPSSIVAGPNLQFGRFFLPATGSASIGIVCGDTGRATLNDTGALVAPGSPAPQCGQVTLTPGINLSFNLRFGGTPATVVTHPDGATLTTRYNLSDASGNPPIISFFFPTGSTESVRSPDFPGTAGIPQNFYIGGNVTALAGAALGEYTGTYEILFTVVP